jgi:hypothetical protein
MLCLGLVPYWRASTFIHTAGVQGVQNNVCTSSLTKTVRHVHDDVVVHNVRFGTLPHVYAMFYIPRALFVTPLLFPDSLSSFPTAVGAHISGPQLPLP